MPVDFDRLFDRTEKIFEKLDKIDEAIRGEDGLCNRMTRVETNLTNHLENQQRKFNKTTVILGIVVGVIALAIALK